MRIVAGQFRGRKLLVPAGQDVRPTSDKVKEALFSILGPPRRREGQRFRVLDLFAGTGALALEALSRGADEAVLVEQEKRAADVAEKNIEAVGVEAQVTLLRREAGDALKSLGGPEAHADLRRDADHDARRDARSFDWIFLDPPYEGGALDRALRILSTTTLVAGVVIAEHHAKNSPDERYGSLVLDERRRWGDTTVSFYRMEDVSTAPSDPELAT